ncbi:DnaD domain protein [Schinkia azotoformans]|uniref:DnaD domain protein n=1 Tax=Schinkia azotoformans TaxID=1454 RepID=UPI002DB729C7|nr:DnaD domain protein [Schinkia azotoformans]MEC1716996.1 DnaD domain protein [Schinkia azotoformans]MEC1743801.1 DnaD domain protein [Schinkia azotoformans]MEC1747827.1 DnaD domain protein [Schinkia azotoformans]MEC1760508.1 DnaD domain protein [Schinkia azotoformans]MEC1769489.1 DnaD domain protein [Schinkia azotoformans]
MAEIIVSEKPQKFTLVDNWILEDTAVFETIHEKMVYIALKKFNFSNCGKVFPGMKRIAKMCMISESTARRTLKQLKDKGLIDIIHRVNEKQGQETNVYVLKDYQYVIPNTEGGLSEIQRVSVPEKDEGLSNGFGAPVTVIAEEYECKNTNSNKTKGRIEVDENPFSFYEKNFGFLTPFIAEDITSWIEDLSSELVLHALKITLESNSKRWSYTKSILKNWHFRKVKCIQDLDEVGKKDKPVMHKKKDPFAALERYRQKHGIGEGEWR